MKLATADNRVTIMKLHKDQNIYKMRLTHADRKLRVEKNRETEEQNRQLLRDITSVLNSKQEEDKRSRRKQVIEGTVGKVKKHLKKVQEKKSQWYNKKEEEEIQKQMVRLEEQSKLPTIKSDTFLLNEKKKEMSQLYKQERLLRVQDVKECLEEQREEYYNRLRMELLDKQEKAEIAKQHIEKRGPYKYISHKWV